MDVWIRDPIRTRRGRVRPMSGSAVLRESGVGTWILDLPAEDPVVARLAEGWGVIVMDEGQALLSGPLTKIETRAGKTRDVTVSGVTDMVALADRLTYPDPAHGPAAQATGYYKDSGAAGAVISRLVDRNCGPGALPARRTPGLVVPASTVGAASSVNTRLKPVVDEVAKLATAGGLVVDVVQDGANLVLVQRAARDLGRAVRLTQVTGEVGDATMSLTAPETTVVIVGGQGQGAARTLEERTAAAPGWGGRRIEIFQDRRDTDEAGELEKAALETLEKGAASATAALEVRDTPRRRFGTHYLLGDTVTVDLGNGARVTEPVRAVELSWDEHGRTVKLTVGTHASEDDNAPAWVKRITALSRRLRGLESI